MPPDGTGETAMKRLFTAIAAAGLLLAGPALADRAGHSGKNQLAGSALEKAYSKHREARRDDWRGDDRRKRISRHRPARGDRDHRRGRDGRRDWDKDRGRDRGRDHKKHRRKHHGRGHDRRGRSYGDRYKHRYKRKYRHHGRGHYGKRHRRHHRHHWRPDRFRYGYRWRRLPGSFVRISFGGLGFFYNDGIFYRPRDRGYVVTRAPIGAVVHSLPGTAVSVIFGGHSYYVAYDTYYRWDSTRRGYRVVANPGFQ